MKIATTPSLNNLELVFQGDYVFVLAQLYKKDERYREMIKEAKEKGLFLIMDCGTGDKNFELSNEELLDLCEEILPNEVVPRDVLFNKDQTIENLYYWIQELVKRNLIGKVDIHFVPQGNTIAEYLECYEFALNYPLVKTIGLSKICIPHIMKGAESDQEITDSRVELMKILSAKKLIRKPLHFLGMQDVFEFNEYAENFSEGDRWFMRSTDSCASILAGMNHSNWVLSQNMRLTTPRDYFESEPLQPSQKTIALRNIEVLREVCKKI